jgi:hypothetical protein
MPVLIEKRYLGDSVYAEVENGMIMLTTNNGEGASNTIYLEPEIMDALAQYYSEAKAVAAERHPADCLCDACTCGRCGNRKHEGKCKS